VAALALGNGFHFADEAGYTDAARRLLSLRCGSGQALRFAQDEVLVSTELLEAH
jgi:hypothetical protein